jgi:hypothetical protein
MNSQFRGFIKANVSMFSYERIKGNIIAGNPYGRRSPAKGARLRQGFCLWYKRSMQYECEIL